MSPLPTDAVIRSLRYSSIASGYNVSPASSVSEQAALRVDRHQDMLPGDFCRRRLLFVVQSSPCIKAASSSSAAGMVRISCQRLSVTTSTSTDECCSLANRFLLGIFCRVVCIPKSWLRQNYFYITIPQRQITSRSLFFFDGDDVVR